MKNPFFQTGITFKISFKCLYKHISIFEENYVYANIDDVLTLSTLQISSSTIESAPDDLWLFEIYIPYEPDIIKIENNFTKFCKLNNISIDYHISLEKIEDLDWVKQYAAELHPIIVGRFFISSTINKNLCPTGKLPIFIEASRAFGTGQHDTTSGCIEGLEYLAQKKFKNIIDIGTGTGILAICANKIWQKAKVIACDIEEVAISIAIENAKLNDVNVLFYKNDCNQILHSKDDKNKFDLIISNILAKPLIDLSKEISEIAEDGGYLILSGLLENQMSEVLQSFVSKGFRYQHIINKHSWSILILKY